MEALDQKNASQSGAALCGARPGALSPPAVSLQHKKTARFLMEPNGLTVGVAGVGLTDIVQSCFPTSFTCLRDVEESDHCQLCRS